MGQLDYVFYDLLEVGAAGGRAWLGTVISVESGGTAIELALERGWPGDGGARDPAPRVAAPGAGGRCRVELSQGVEWTDPDESPQEIRLAGWLHPNLIEPGARLLIVDHLSTDALPVSERNLELVELAFDPGRLRRYLAGASDEQLTADLSCPHLGGVVKGELQRSGRLTGTRVLIAFDGRELQALLTPLFEDFSYDERAAFLDDALAHFKGTAPRPWGDRLAEVCEQAKGMMEVCQQRRDARTWACIAALGNLLGPHRPREREVMGGIDFRLGKIAADPSRSLSLGPFNPLMACYLLFDYSDIGGFSHYLRPRLEGMTEPERHQLLVCLIRQIEAERQEPRERLRRLDADIVEVVSEACAGFGDGELESQLRHLADVLA